MLVVAACLAAGFVVGGALIGERILKSATHGRTVTGHSGSSAFAGVPQRGPALGSPRAPLTLIEYVDLRCGACRSFQRSIVPAVVERDVRSGRLRLLLAPLGTPGSRSDRAARLAVAASGQDRMCRLLLDSDSSTVGGIRSQLEAGADRPRVRLTPWFVVEATAADRSRGFGFVSRPAFMERLAQLVPEGPGPGPGRHRSNQGLST